MYAHLILRTKPAQFKHKETNRDVCARSVLVPPRHSALCQRVSLARFGGKPRLTPHGSFRKLRVPYFGPLILIRILLPYFRKLLSLR